VVVDRQDRIGGVSLHTSTIPSKTLRWVATVKFARSAE
jgi:hypothetical protein